MKTYKNHRLAHAVALAGALSIVAMPTYADTILGIYAGAGAWNTDIDGDINGDIDGDSNISTDQLGFDKSTNSFLYVALEHPVPFLPNVRLGVTDLTIDGSSIINETFTFQGEDYESNTSTRSEIDLSHTDLTFYYEILDNWITMDLGLTARSFDGSASITGNVDGSDNITESIDLDGTIPMIYGKAQLDLPFTGWHVAGTLNYIGYSDSKISDFEGKVGYQSNGLVFDVGVDIGYRTMNLDIQESGDLNADVSVDGPFAAITVHF